MRNIPIVTKNLLIVNVVAFLVCFLMGKNGSDGYVLNDLLGLHFFLASDFHIYQWLPTCLCMEVLSILFLICLLCGCLDVS